jgi:hypothetical protein
MYIGLVWNLSIIVIEDTLITLKIPDKLNKKTSLYVDSRNLPELVSQCLV